MKFSAKEVCVCGASTDIGVEHIAELVVLLRESTRDPRDPQAATTRRRNG